MPRVPSELALLLGFACVGIALALGGVALARIRRARDEILRRSSTYRRAALEHGRAITSEIWQAATRRPR